MFGEEKEGNKNSCVVGDKGRDRSGVIWVTWSEDLIPAQRLSPHTMHFFAISFGPSHAVHPVAHANSPSAFVRPKDGGSAALVSRIASIFSRIAGVNFL